MGFSDEMKGHDSDWEETEAAPDTGGRLPDGYGQAQLVELRVEQNDHGWALLGRFRNATGSVRRWWSLPPTEKQAPYTKKDLSILGFDGPISGLETFCESEQALGLLCHINVKTTSGTDRDFTNVYLNGAGERESEDHWQQLTDWTAAKSQPAPRQAAGVSGGGADADFAGDDDIPF